MLIHGDICHKGSAFLVHNSPYGASYTLNFNENDDFMAYDTIGVPINNIAYVARGNFRENDLEMFNSFKKIFEGSEQLSLILLLIVNRDGSINS
ncbi:3131_t:CDS:2 [Funneliformis geosporum]|nr:3131_t:CDS:2 [Funneliformis geosporum]